VLQIIIQGRVGHGAQLAGSLLPMAQFAEGREVQSFATFGGARRGTPISSFIRMDDKPIRLRCDSTRACWKASSSPPLA
jgi:pyruvate ferredoxin oxidoreductase gamma subunit